MRISPTTSFFILTLILQLTTTIFGQQCKEIEDAKWSYRGKNNGPKSWKKTYEECGGKMQSPIMLLPESAKSPTQAPLKMVGYDMPITKAEIKNTGYTVQVKPKDCTDRYIEIEETRYNLQEIHFHWAKDGQKGSEHGIDYGMFEMEAHFVHLSEGDEFAVLGVLFILVEGDIETFEPIVSSFPDIKYKTQMKEYEGQINLMDFFPTERKYYGYTGSLTTPPCTEGVTWAVFSSLQPVGRNQLAQFAELYAVKEDEVDHNEVCKLETNSRPKQQQNGRDVYLYDSTQ